MRSWLALAAALILFPAELLAAPDIPVYINSLAPGWQDWSWSTTRSFSVGNPRRGASGTSVSVEYTGAWGGLYLHPPGALTASDYQTLRFWTHGGTDGGQGFQVVAYDSQGGTGTAVVVNPPVANAWTEVQVPVAALGVADITGLVWQDTTGGRQPVYYLDDILLVGTGGGGDTAITLAVDANASRRAISPHIYGMNFADPALAAELALPVNRWGGNSTTRYNWLIDVYNTAADWYFENITNAHPSPAQLPDGSAADRFVEANMATSTQTIMTLPLIGWVAKRRVNNHPFDCGFKVSRYGPQQAVDPYDTDCGNGKYTNGMPITVNDPLDTSIAVGPSFMADWIAHLVGRYGTAAQGGVTFYNLDNEPMLWSSTHRDVHRQPTSYDELRDRTYQYGAAVKAADPTAQTLGPVLFGWTAYFYSAADQDVPQADWWNYRPDRKAHGDTPFIEWYLQQMRAYEQAHGVRILDYMDLHYYPQAEAVALSPAGDATVQARRLRTTRSLWDPNYIDESWINDRVRLIPRMRDWVNAHYPGTKLAITEYNWGALDHINGALAQADVLGIFGREGLDLATLWSPPEPGEPGAFAFRMYRNYDGAGARFGETSVRAASSDAGKTSGHAAVRTDGALTLMVVNKTTGQVTCNLTMTNFMAAGPAQVYRYSMASPNQIVRLADLTLSAAGAAALNLPASSITLLVVPPLPPIPGDFDGDADVDANDFLHFDACNGSATIPPTAICADADLDGDEDVDQTDYGLFQRCLSGTGNRGTPGCAG